MVKWKDTALHKAIASSKEAAKEGITARKDYLAAEKERIDALPQNIREEHAKNEALAGLKDLIGKHLLKKANENAIEQAIAADDKEYKGGKAKIAALDSILAKTAASADTAVKKVFEGYNKIHGKLLAIKSALDVLDGVLKSADEKDSAGASSASVDLEALKNAWDNAEGRYAQTKKPDDFKAKSAARKAYEAAAAKEASDKDSVPAAESKVSIENALESVNQALKEGGVRERGLFSPNCQDLATLNNIVVGKKLGMNQHKDFTTKALVQELLEKAKNLFVNWSNLKDFPTLDEWEKAVDDKDGIIHHLTVSENQLDAIDQVAKGLHDLTGLIDNPKDKAVGCVLWDTE